ncbi:hypothetical protein EVAR_50391_1 [Eumeta japonica]|uniref:Uncharacterized protein n=1 Tax=Eumeta variegata TaxID=151549 RepID=A0A4C1WXV7_EUMVA|nr:hypothetical protein EVAR_50391_1 [Eumeta japonica]
MKKRVVSWDTSSVAQQNPYLLQARRKELRSNNWIIKSFEKFTNNRLSENKFMAIVFVTETVKMIHRRACRSASCRRTCIRNASIVQPVCSGRAHRGYGPHSVEPEPCAPPRRWRRGRYRRPPTTDVIAAITTSEAQIDPLNLT